MPPGLEFLIPCAALAVAVMVAMQAAADLIESLHRSRRNGREIARIRDEIAGRSPTPNASRAP